MEGGGGATWRRSPMCGLGDMVGPSPPELSWANVSEIPSSLPAGDRINTQQLLISRLWREKNASADVPTDRSRRSDADYRGRGWDWVPARPETVDRAELRIMWRGGVRTRSEISKLPPRCGDAARAYIRRPAGQPRRIRKQTLVQFGRCEHPKTPFTLHHQCTHTSASYFVETAGTGKCRRAGTRCGARQFTVGISPISGFFFSLPLRFANL